MVGSNPGYFKNFRRISRELGTSLVSRVWEIARTQGIIGLYESICRELNRGSTRQEHVSLDYAISLISPTPGRLPRLKSRVDLVVPVHGVSPVTRRLFETLLRNTDMSHRLIIVDDGSPGDDSQHYLRGIAEKWPRASLIRNEEAQGFVIAANLGLQASENDVVLLNSDVVLPLGWLERIMSPIETDPMIASTTPFSNVGSLCTFPYSMQGGPLLEGIPLDLVDSYFRRVRSDQVAKEIPTGVGYCLGMSRRAIDDVGLFDLEFGLGYGEENDWCLRAEAAGYRHEVAVDLFVEHEGSVTFGEESTFRSQKNLQILRQRHPGYVSRVDSYLREDPLLALRQVLLLLILCNSAPVPTTLVASLDRKHGPVEYELSECVLLSVIGSSKGSSLLLTYREHSLAFRVENKRALKLALDQLKIDSAFVDGEPVEISTLWSSLEETGILASLSWSKPAEVVT